MNKHQSSKYNTFDIIYSVVKEIPRGRIATYGQIAAMVKPGLPARIVGYALHCLPENTDIPWHRVINSQGKISYFASSNEYDSLQQKILEQEGVIFSSEGKTDLKKYLWSANLLNK
jgi:methylated-DNA-protein-cysteine methyltransferase-like protein